MIGQGPRHESRRKLRAAPVADRAEAVRAPPADERSKKPLELPLSRCQTCQGRLVRECENMSLGAPPRAFYYIPHYFLFRLKPQKSSDNSDRSGKRLARNGLGCHSAVVAVTTARRQRIASHCRLGIVANPSRGPDCGRRRPSASIARELPYRRRGDNERQSSPLHN